MQQSNKHQGFIMRKKVEKEVQSPQARSRSHDQTITNHTTLNSDFEKTPGEIKKLKRDEIYVEKIDEEVYYNADVYFKYQKMKRPVVKYEESQHIAIQVRKSPQKRKQLESPNKQTQQASTSSNKGEGNQFFINIHNNFDLNKFHSIYHLLSSIISSLQINQLEVLKSIKAYIHFISKQNIDSVASLKFVPNKRELLKQSFALERQAIISICFIIAIGCFEKMKNYCSSLLKYVLQNFLLALNLLAQENNQYVDKLFVDNCKDHLKGKGFQGIRSINELMTSLIVKIARSDPLFAGQFCKIIENYSTHSVKALLYFMLTFFAFYLHATKNADKIPFLAASPGPYILQPPSQQYTLVIDFVKVFIDNSVLLRKQIKKQQYFIRPYSQYFLGEMSKYFQIVSFSDYMPIQCNKIISKIDEKRCVKHKLYKYHVDYEVRKKQMEKIGRNLDRVILLDTTQSLKTDNLLLINAWKGESNDAILAQICPLLAMIAVKKLSALQSLKKIKQSIAKNASLGLKYINCGFDL